VNHWFTTKGGEIVARPKPAKPVAKRFTVTIPTELDPELRKIKQDQFFDKSQTEMIQYLIRLGLEAARKPA
jgi:hypothetical protein